MKRLFKSLILVLIIVVSAFSIVACDNGNGTGKSKKGLVLKKHTGEEFYTLYKYVDEGDGIEVLDLAEKAGDKTIGRIVAGAFSKNDTLVEIIVPNSVIEIQEGAFAGMTKLQKITVPFTGLNKNADAYFNQTENTDEKATNEKRCFSFIFGKESYEYGAEMSINYGADLVTAYLPARITQVTVKANEGYNLPMYAFSGIKLVETITLDSAVVAIGEHAFEGCRDLTTLKISSSVKTIYTQAFNGCESLTAIRFDGTKEEWGQVELKDEWMGDAEIEKIICNDGEFSL